MRTNGVSTISLVMLRLKAVQEEPVDSAVLIFTAIWEHYLGDIFGDLFAVAADVRNESMKGANVRTAVGITFEEAVFGCENKLILN